MIPEIPEKDLLTLYVVIDSVDMIFGVFENLDLVPDKVLENAKTHGRLEKRKGIYLSRERKIVAVIDDQLAAVPLDVDLVKREDELRRSAIAKLSPEERRALGLGDKRYGYTSEAPDVIGDPRSYEEGS